MGQLFLDFNELGGSGDVGVTGGVITLLRLYGIRSGDGVAVGTGTAGPPWGDVSFNSEGCSITSDIFRGGEGIRRGSTELVVAGMV